MREQHRRHAGVVVENLALGESCLRVQDFGEVGDGQPAIAYLNGRLSDFSLASLLDGTV